jgi:predicted DNA-binding transcriptional regulator AlpA
MPENPLAERQITILLPANEWHRFLECHHEHVVLDDGIVEPEPVRMTTDEVAAHVGVAVRTFLRRMKEFKNLGFPRPVGRAKDQSYLWDPDEVDQWFINAYRTGAIRSPGQGSAETMARLREQVLERFRNTPDHVLNAMDIVHTSVIAERAGYPASTIKYWSRVYPDFPKPIDWGHAGDSMEWSGEWAFDWHAVAEWLRTHGHNHLERRAALLDPWDERDRAELATFAYGRNRLVATFGARMEPSQIDIMAHLIETGVVSTSRPEEQD